MNLVGDYGSGSSSDEEDAPSAVARAPSAPSAPAAISASRQAAPVPAPGRASPFNAAPSTSTVLPSASDMFGSTGSEVGSSGAHVGRAFVVGQQEQRDAPVAGTKRPASGRFPISDVAAKSGRGGQQGSVSAKKVNTLIPPQMRGRPNVATQDLEKMGYKARPQPKS